MSESLPLKFGFQVQVANALWRLVWILLFRISPPFAVGWRRLLLRAFGAKIGTGVRIHATTRIRRPWNLVLGDGVRVEPQVILNANGGINIGSGTLISQYAHLCAANHDYRDPDMRYLASPIVVGQGCWIATDAFVGPDCHIGNGSMLAARSTAFGQLPGGMLLIGEPATPVRPRPAANHTSGNS